MGSCLTNIPCMYEEPRCDMDLYESMSFEIKTQAALGSRAMKQA